MAERHQKKPSIENHLSSAIVCCSKLPRQRWRQELLHPQSQALQLSLSSHVRSVGERKLWFLCLWRPLCYSTSSSREDTCCFHLEFSHRTVINHSLSGEKKEILIRGCGAWQPRVRRLCRSLQYSSCFVVCIRYSCIDNGKNIRH